MTLPTWRARALAPFLPALVYFGVGCDSTEPEERDPRPKKAVVEVARSVPAPASQRSIHTGKVRRWPEATQYLRFATSGGAPTVDMGAPRSSGLDAFWSVASTDPGAGFFYADSIRGTEETRVAHPDGVAHVSEIRDASALELVRDSVGPVPVGGIVVIEHTPSRRYLALVVDAIEKTNNPHEAGAGPYAYADVTWYLTEPGQSDFGLAR
jgi:hypothetical protein